MHRYEVAGLHFHSLETGQHRGCEQVGHIFGVNIVEVQVLVK